MKLGFLSQPAIHLLKLGFFFATGFIPIFSFRSEPWFSFATCLSFLKKGGMDPTGLEPVASAWFGTFSGLGKNNDSFRERFLFKKGSCKGSALPTELWALRFNIAQGNFFNSFHGFFCPKRPFGPVHCSSTKNKGGDPSAGSPTDTLLQLSPPCRTQNRLFLVKKPHQNSTQLA